MIEIRSDITVVFMRGRLAWEEEGEGRRGCEHGELPLHFFQTV
jgi:hypothetical protein